MGPIIPEAHWQLLLPRALAIGSKQGGLGRASGLGF
jgi:hypothetical protein